MLFNRHGLQQKNWRMVKKGKHILFGCSLFFVVGGMSIGGSQVVHASETNASRVVEEKVVANNTSSEISAGEASTLDKKQVSEASNDKKAEKIKQTQDVEKPAEKKEQKENLIGESGEKPLVKKEVNKKELKDLVDKIKKTDISKKTEKLVKELNLILSRAEEALDNKETTQEEIDKEVKALKEVFEKLEDKPKEDKKSEAKEKAESKKEEKSNVEKNTKEKQQENTTEDVARKHNEKITKVTETVTEINSIANQINYEFSDAEKELVKTAEKLPTFYNSDKYNEETIQKLLKEVIYLRNKVANRMTRVHSGKRDPRNGKVIENSGESTFRGIRFTPLENTQNGKVVSNADTNLTYFNSDSFWIKTQVKGEKFRHDSANTYYLVKKVTLSGKPFKDLSIIVSTGKGDRRASTTIDNINNPNVQAGILGNLGTNGIITPGNYQVVLTVNDTVSPGNNYNIIYNITIKPQSERNTVRDLTPTYVDDVRHLTEAEKTALIEKFKTEHPDVVNRAQHIDFDHAEISSDGTTMTVHFKDGLSTKTIQTNAQNDVVAKYPSLTTLVGDPHEFYKNPRNLVKSKTNHEVPQTARVTWKTPFDFSQPGTKNAVVTVSYDNGVTKDVTTPYTVLDFVGKQDKSINQNQSGELGDARSYITLSNGTAPATDLTIRWKGGSSTVDTSAAGVQHKEIEILRGNHLMKTVRVPVEIVDNINPTITAPDSVLLTRLEGLPSEINISAQDNNKGVGLKDSNPITVENLPNPLFYNPRTSKIEINGVIPNNFQNGKSSIQVTVKAVDKNGNPATKTITFNVQAQTDKYNAVANPQKQTVSYDARPDAGLSVNKNGLPAGTTYTWATTPSTTTGPGDKAGVVTVSYPDGSTDTVNVTIAVRKLSDEYEPTGNKIVRNQNAPVTNNDLKAAVTISNNGNSKVKSVTPVSSISTANAGMQTIRATVTYLDNTTDPVDIPLEVKDVTAPTIQTPSDRQNWDLIALDRTFPSIKVAATDNLGGSGIKSTTVTGLPDFLVYDEATKTIKFKNGVQEVIKLPVGQDSKTYTATIQVTDNANNPSQRQVTITVKSMTTKYNATPNGQKQTVSYGGTPDAGTSINKNGLPTGTTYTWATTPSTTTGPGEKAGVVTVTYPDGSKDTVNVTVNVRRLADEYAPTGTKITREQNTAVTNDDLKAAVTISNNGNNKVKSVTPVGTISTAEFGNKTINATVTYLDDTTDPVMIPLEVRDVTKPTIQTPTDRQNWDLVALDRTWPSIKVATTDNPGGSGVKSTTVTGLPNFLTYDEATKTIKFKNGVQEVTKLPEGTDVQTHNITITVTDNANNSNSAQVTITVKSMTTKYDATANSEKQTVSYGDIPDAGTSVNKTNLPAGTTYTWATTPSTTTGPGDKAGVVTVKYPDGSKDTVNVTVNVRALNDEYKLTATEIVVNQNDQISNDRLKTVVSATSKVGNVNGTDKISTVTAPTINTASYGSQNITATVTFKDRTVKEVTIPIKVKDVTKPTISAPGENTNWEITALDKALPNMEVRAEDNANGSGIKSVSVTGLPDYLEYDKTTNSIKFKAGKQEVEKLPVNTPSKEFTLKIRAEDNAGNVSEKVAKITVYSMSEKNTPTPLPQTVDNGQVPKAEESVNKTGLPEGTTVTWKTTPEVSTPGSHPGVALVHYPDGTEDEVEVPVTVKEQKETFNPTAKEPNQTVRHNEVPDPEKSINTNGLPEGTTYTWSEQPNTSTPGSKPGKVLITYPDKSTEEVPVTVEVTPQKDEYTPTAIPQTVDNGQVPKAEESVNKTGLPEGTTVTWKTTPEVSTPGSHPGVALVHYPDGTEDEVTVQIVVRHSNEKGIPEVQLALPEFAGGVNTPDSPSRDIPEYTDPVGTSSTDGEGNKITPPTVEIPEYTDPVGTSSTDGEGNEITPPTVEIPEYTDPIGTSSTDGEGNVITPPIVDIPEYTDPIGTSSTDGEGNEITPPIVDIPEYTDPVGTSITDGEGNVITPPTAEVPEYTGGVNGEPEVQPILPEFAGGVNGEPEVQLALPEFNGGANGNPEVQPSLPEFNGGVNGDPEDQQTLPEFAGGVNGDPEVQLVLPEFAGGVNGDPEVQPVLPEFAGGVNGDPEAQPTLPEFNGGVNGESEVQSALPEFSGGVNGDPEIQEELPKYVGKLKDESEIRSSFRDKTSNVATKRLANTGQSQNNSELAGLGLAIVGLFAAIKRRKNEEE